MLPQHRIPSAASSLPKHHLALLQIPLGLLPAHLVLLTLQVTGQALQGGHLAPQLVQLADDALLV